ncbi:MAG: hypothetical protein ACI86H_001768 [bacterium]|jgi:hypothetical protein
MSDKIVSLDQFRKKKNQEREETPVYGTLVWLHCPTCKNIEYTEVIAPHGRQHKCGTQVEEIEVELDLRAEATLVALNTQKLQEVREKKTESRWKKILNPTLTHVLDALQHTEDAYLSRIQAAAGKTVEPYPLDREDLIEKLPIATKTQFDLLISHFRLEPEKRFPTQ